MLRLLNLGVAISGKEPAAMRDLLAGTPSYINPEQWDVHFKKAGCIGCFFAEMDVFSAVSGVFFS